LGVSGSPSLPASEEAVPTPNHPSDEIVAQQRDSFIERLLQATRGMLEIFSIYLGVRP
jgi:hypothetical protein